MNIRTIRQVYRRINKEGMTLAPRTPFWTHASVLRLTRTEDPVEFITQSARSLVFDAIEAGWTGPPYDPITLAEHLQISVVPREDILDARTVPLQEDSFQVEFNPNRPRGRIRYSIAHEIAHTLFPDCRERVRNRAAREHLKGDDWQLELLCNIAAAELLMPIGSFPDLKDRELTIDTLMALRQQFDVSTEALLLRAVKLTDHACAMFCASRREKDDLNATYEVDYAVHSRSWPHKLSSGTLLPEQSLIRECTAIGFTAKGDEDWPDMPGTVHVEAVGIAPFPKHRYPRVVGILRPLKDQQQVISEIISLRGDATKPRGDDYRIIAHVVNDRTPRWGGGFALVVRKTFPGVQEDFVTWAHTHPDEFSLGHGQLSSVNETLSVFSMICQHGFGRSTKPRIRYAAMKTCLDELATIAIGHHASVHMPRIGCGLAGGSWQVVSELVQDSLCNRGIRVTVYALPSSTNEVHQADLFGE